MTIQNISVFGGGAWGTALALTCARAGRTVTLWEHEPANAERLEKNRESRFLPGVRLDDGIKVVREFAQAARADAILQASGSRLQASGSRLQASGFRIQDSGSRIQD